MASELVGQQFYSYDKPENISYPNVTAFLVVNNSVNTNLIVNGNIVLVPNGSYSWQDSNRVMKNLNLTISFSDVTDTTKNCTISIISLINDL